MSVSFLTRNLILTKDEGDETGSETGSESMLPEVTTEEEQDNNKVQITC